MLRRNVIFFFLEILALERHWYLSTFIYCEQKGVNYVEHDGLAVDGCVCIDPVRGPCTYSSSSSNHKKVREYRI